jgi:hypothetical protein
MTLRCVQVRERALDGTILKYTQVGAACAIAPAASSSCHPRVRLLPLQDPMVSGNMTRPIRDLTQPAGSAAAR